jgi:DNA-binding MarR family transcriptional regulator
MERFTRYSAPPQRPLTPAQERSLVALAALCPGLGEEATAAAIAARSGLRHGATTLALRGLERRRLVTGHGEDSDPRFWAPTLTGRAHAKHLRGRAAEEERHTREESRAEDDDWRTRDETGGG